MNNQNNYNTKQKNLIIDVLHANEDSHLTAEEITEILKKQETPVGRSTVYRYLDFLVANNRVTKYFSADNIVSYQYLDCENDCHYHLKCEKCGSLIHVSCDEFQKFFKHLASEHKFIIDPNKIFMLGLCEKCQKGDKNNEKNTCHCH